MHVSTLLEGKSYSYFSLLPRVLTGGLKPLKWSWFTVSFSIRCLCLLPFQCILFYLLIPQPPGPKYWLVVVFAPSNVDHLGQQLSLVAANSTLTKKVCSGRGNFYIFGCE